MKKLIVAVDLDGVLADYSQGWKGLHEIGVPLPGAVQFTHDLGAMYEVCIHSCRCSPSAQARITGIWESKEYMAAPVIEWLDGWGFYWDDLYQGCGKPLASAYIDDNAFRCTPMSDPGAYWKTLHAITRMAVPPEKPPAAVRSSAGSPDPEALSPLERRIVEGTIQRLCPSRTVTSRPADEVLQAEQGPPPSVTEHSSQAWLGQPRLNSLWLDQGEQSVSVVPGG